MSGHFYILFYPRTIPILMRQILILICCASLSAQVRIGDMRSITSTLNVRDLDLAGNNVFLATGGGLVNYNSNTGDYTVYTKDHGLADTDLQTVHVGPKGLVWMGSNMSIQIWDPKAESIRAWFQLDMEVVSGFSTYNEMVYGAVKNDGEWGIMEFIHSNDKIYYRDFYGRSDIQFIDEIFTFGDQLFLLSDLGLISGNPHLKHPIYWTKAFENIDENILTLDVANNVLALVTDKAIYSVALGEYPVALIREDDNIKSVKSISVISNQQFSAISDSIIFDVGTDRLKAVFTDPNMKFTGIISDQNGTWVGNQTGFGHIDGQEFESPFNHIAENGPSVQSPEAIQFIGNDQWIMASKNGLSLTGWFNWSASPVSTELNENLNIQKSPIHLGAGISNIIFHSGKIIVGLNYSSSAGMVSVDISNGLTLDKLFYPKKLSYGLEYLYSVKDMSIDGKDNIWVISDNSENEPLSVFSGNDNRPILIAESKGNLNKNAQTITVDNFNRVWMGSPSGLVMYKYSGNVLNPSAEVWATEDVNPGMPKRNPLAINVSDKNRLWILTSVGLLYKNLQVSETNPISETGPLGNNNELYPYFPNGVFDRQSKIRFGPRGNVWVTSQTDGVHIITENGEYWPDINGLNTSNSNLLSNHVNDVTFDGEEGLAYIATDKGISVIRIPFAVEKESYSSVGIFPSPFRIPDAQPMTIEGLKDNSSLMIMTLNGQVIRKIPNSEVQGYQAFWDGRDSKGRLVGSGVYLIAIYDQKGASSMEKVAVIRK